MPDLTSVSRREDALLVVVDVQQRLAAAMERRDAVAASVVRLVKTAALVGVPIVVTRQYPEGLGDTDPTVAHALAAVEAAGHAVFRRRQARVRLLRRFRIHRRRLGQRAFAARARWDGDAHLHRSDGAARPALRPRGAGSPRTRAARATPLPTRSRSTGCGQRGRWLSSAESVMYELVGAAGTDEFRSLLRIVKE